MTRTDSDAEQVKCRKKEEEEECRKKEEEEEPEEEEREEGERCYKRALRLTYLKVNGVGAMQRLGETPIFFIFHRRRAAALTLQACT
jgi:hypothetical protein